LHGEFSNVTTWFEQSETESLTRGQYSEVGFGVLKTMIEEVDPSRKLYLQSLKDKSKELWEASKIGMNRENINLEKELNNAPDVSEKGDELECLQRKVDDLVMNLEFALEEGKNDVKMPPINDALPIHLFNHGFDVWIVGNRGTLYQRGHYNDKITEDKYWDFSPIEMATEDLTTELEYAANTSA